MSVGEKRGVKKEKGKQKRKRFGEERKEKDTGAVERDERGQIKEKGKERK